MKMPNLSSPCSPRSFFIFIYCFLVFPLLLLLLLLATPSSSSWSSSSHGGDHLEAEKVTMSIYYETMCPYCAEFIVNHVVSIFQTGLISIVNLRMIPWGNAFPQTRRFLCLSVKHGEEECLLNAVEACPIRIYPDVLILHNAEETLKLNPPPKYLSWVTVNNEPLFRDYNHVIKYICNAYRGNSKPSAFKNTISIPQTPSLCDQPNTKSVSP